jgi:hypothetical protein|tara:strand:+ start:181 stop:486 length:306 start_codon:yes stop_codon:yes gene_type:complete
MIYASTFGLAGPASAMVQCQAIVQAILVAIFSNLIPSNIQIAGMGCAIAGAIVMSLDFSFFFKNSANDEPDNDSLIDENGFIIDDHLNDSLKDITDVRYTE